MKYVALLRGINVGGKNKLPMKDLVPLFETAGATAVQTYIQSGNVVFEANAAIADSLANSVPDSIRHGFGYRVPLILRSAKEIVRVVANNPFLPKAEPQLLHVAFLSNKPNASAVKQLDPKRSAPDEFKCVGQELYLKLPDGMGKTKLTNAYIETKLGVTATARNWKTVLKLAEMCS